MPSIAFAVTQFFKQPKHTSQKSILSFGTVILQKHLSFMERSAFTQPPGCNKRTLSARLFLPLPFTELHLRSNQTNVWYLDDGCISGDPQTVLSNAAIIRNGLSSVGLEINNSNCELLIVNNTTSQERSQTSKLFQDEFPSISIPAPNLWQLLGSPLHQDSTPLHLEAKTKILDNIIENLELIEPHQAFFIMKNCFSIPKLIYLLRSALIFKCKEELEVFDTETNMEKICNVSFGEENWSQASLPIRHAGLGLCSVADLSLPCFLSSSHTCQPFTSLSQPGNPLWGWKRCNWRLVQTPWFITIRKGNTSSLGWPRLQGYTQFPAKHK